MNNKKRIALTLLAGLGISGAAEAGNLPYYVATQATASSGNFAQYQYNFYTIGGGQYTSRTNSGSQHILSGCKSGCGQSGSDVNSTRNPLLTSSYDQASASQPYIYVGTNKVKVGFQSTASANANLAAGTIGVSATGQGELYGNQGGNGSATSYLQDQLKFNVTGANANTTTDIGVKFILDGTLSATAPAGMSDVRAIDSFGNAVIDTSVSDGNLNLASSLHNFTPFISNFSQSGWASYTLSDSNPGQITFSGIYAIQGANQSLGLSMFINTNAQMYASSNYSNTNGIQLTLPTGVSYTSDSGVFLANISPVPEPESYAMMLAGLGLIGLMVHRRKKSDSSNMMFMAA